MKFFKWLLYLLALAAFIWFVFFRPLNKDSISTTQDTETPSSEDPKYDENTELNTIDEGVTNYSSQDDVEVTGTTETLTETTKSTQETNTSTSSNSINLNSKYLIVVGSFGKKSNADRMLRRVKKSGKDGVITNIRGLHRVVTASTDDNSDARNLRSHFTHIYKEQAFILEQ